MDIIDDWIINCISKVDSVVEAIKPRDVVIKLYSLGGSTLVGCTLFVPRLRD